MEKREASFSWVEPVKLRDPNFFDICATALAKTAESALFAGGANALDALLFATASLGRMPFASPISRFALI
jgi:hypothetical protein